MIFRFLDVELDTARRELRRGGVAVALQPRVFDVLAFLLHERERVVPKDELLDTLWRDVVVTDASLQRAISLARAAVGDGACIRTVPGHGYRFVAPVQVEAPGPPPPSPRQVHAPAPAPATATEAPFRPRFVRVGDVHVAYHTVGEGPLDVVVIPGWVFPMRAFFDHPGIRAWIDRLATYGRVVLLDKRGTGLSDPVKTLPTLQERADDLRAVLDAIGSTRAVLIGASEGGPLGLFCAASFPERVRGLVLCGTFARWTAAPDYPHGWTPETEHRLRDYIAHAWGRGDTIAAIVASRASDPSIAAWAARAEQEGASPGAARELLEMNLRIDVRPLLSSVRVPTVVVHNRRDPVIPVGNGRYLAAHIAGARLLEPDGRDHMLFFEGAEAVDEALRSLIAGAEAAAARFLATVLVAQADGEPPAALAPVVTRYGGVPAGAETAGTSDGPQRAETAWTFDGPQRAIQCALALHGVYAPQGRSVRVGVHAGEVERRGAALAGEGLDTARGIAHAAPAGEVWVSQVLRDLVHGAPLAFVPRGRVRLPDGRAVRALACATNAEISRR